MSDDTPTSFDAFAHEHNLSDRARDIAREAFKLGLSIGKRQAQAIEPAKRREYHHVTDRDTLPGEFR